MATATPRLIDRIQDLRDIALASIAARHSLRWNATTSKLENVNALEYYDPADFGAYTDGTNASATTTAWEECIAAAIADGKPGIRFSGSHLVNPLTINVPLKIVGYGINRSSLICASQGVTALTYDPQLETSTGDGLVACDFLLTGDWAAYTATVSANSVGLLVTNSFSGAGANVGLSLLHGLAIEGFTDNLVLCNHYFTTVSALYSGAFRRYGIRSYNTHTTDSGDLILRDVTVHGVASSVGGFDSTGSSIRIEQGATRIEGGKIFGISGAGHTRGVHIYGTCSDSGETVPSGMIQIRGLQFDSFGANTCIEVDSDWGRGGANTANVGTKIMNVAIEGNNASNCGRMVDLAALSGALHDFAITNNTASGGGGIRVANIAGLFVSGNKFSNETIGGGAAGSGYGPSIPYEETGTVTDVELGVNRWHDFASDPDRADRASASVDTKPDLRTLTVTGGALTLVSHDADETEAISEATVTGATAITFPSLAHGDRGRVYLKHSGASAALSFAVAPSGYTLATSGSFATAADDLLELVEYECIWTASPEKKIIRAVVTSLGSVTGLTTEGGGGETLLVHDDFSGTAANIDGRTPNVLNTPGNTFVINGGSSLFWTDGSGNAHHQIATGSGLGYDLETATQASEVELVIDGDEIAMFVFVNGVDGTSLAFSCARLYPVSSVIQLGTVNAGGTFTQAGSDYSTALANGDVIKVVGDDDDLSVYKNGTLVGTQTIASRPNKTSTFAGARVDANGEGKLAYWKGYSL